MGCVSAKPQNEPYRGQQPQSQQQPAISSPIVSANSNPAAKTAKLTQD